MQLALVMGDISRTASGHTWYPVRLSLVPQTLQIPALCMIARVKGVLSILTHANVPQDQPML